jgi:hypothetical protein
VLKTWLKSEQRCIEKDREGIRIDTFFPAAAQVARTFRRKFDSVFVILNEDLEG